MLSSSIQDMAKDITKSKITESLILNIYNRLDLEKDQKNEYSKTVIETDKILQNLQAHLTKNNITETTIQRTFRDGLSASIKMKLLKRVYYLGIHIKEVEENYLATHVHFLNNIISLCQGIISIKTELNDMNMYASSPFLESYWIFMEKMIPVFSEAISTLHEVYLEKALTCASTKNEMCSKVTILNNLEIIKDFMQKAREKNEEIIIQEKKSAYKVIKDESIEAIKSIEITNSPENIIDCATNILRKFDETSASSVTKNLINANTELSKVTFDILIPLLDKLKTLNYSKSVHTDQYNSIILTIYKKISILTAVSQEEHILKSDAYISLYTDGQNQEKEISDVYFENEINMSNIIELSQISADHPSFLSCKNKMMIILADYINIEIQMHGVKTRSNTLSSITYDAFQKTIMKLKENSKNNIENTNLSAFLKTEYENLLKDTGSDSNDISSHNYVVVKSAFMIFFVLKKVIKKHPKLEGKISDLVNMDELKELIIELNDKTNYVRYAVNRIYYLNGIINNNEGDINLRLLDVIISLGEDIFSFNQIKTFNMNHEKYYDFRDTYVSILKDIGKINSLEATGYHEETLNCLSQENTLINTDEMMDSLHSYELDKYNNLLFPYMMYPNSKNTLSERESKEILDRLQYIYEKKLLMKTLIENDKFNTNEDARVPRIDNEMKKIISLMKLIDKKYNVKNVKKRAREPSKNIETCLAQLITCSHGKNQEINKENINVITDLLRQNILTPSKDYKEMFLAVWNKKELLLPIMNREQKIALYSCCCLVYGQSISSDKEALEKVRDAILQIATLMSEEKSIGSKIIYYLFDVIDSWINKFNEHSIYFVSNKSKLNVKQYNSDQRFIPVIEVLANEIYDHIFSLVDEENTTDIIFCLDRLNERVLSHQRHIEELIQKYKIENPIIDKLTSEEVNTSDLETLDRCKQYIINFSAYYSYNKEVSDYQNILKIILKMLKFEPNKEYTADQKKEDVNKLMELTHMWPSSLLKERVDFEYHLYSKQYKEASVLLCQIDENYPKEKSEVMAITKIIMSHLLMEHLDVLPLSDEKKHNQKKRIEDSVRSKYKENTNLNQFVINLLSDLFNQIIDKGHCSCHDLSLQGFIESFSVKLNEIKWPESIQFNKSTSYSQLISSLGQKLEKKKDQEKAKEEQKNEQQILKEIQEKLNKIKGEETQQKEVVKKIQMKKNEIQEKIRQNQKNEKLKQEELTSKQGKLKLKQEELKLKQEESIKKEEELKLKQEELTSKQGKLKLKQEESIKNQEELKLKQEEEKLKQETLSKIQQEEKLIKEKLEKLEEKQEEMKSIVEMLFHGLTKPNDANLLMQKLTNINASIIEIGGRMFMNGSAPAKLGAYIAFYYLFLDKNVENPRNKAISLAKEFPTNDIDLFFPFINKKTFKEIKKLLIANGFTQKNIKLKPSLAFMLDKNEPLPPKAEMGLSTLYVTHAINKRNQPIIEVHWIEQGELVSKFIVNSNKCEQISQLFSSMEGNNNCLDKSTNKDSFNKLVGLCELNKKAPFLSYEKEEEINGAVIKLDCTVSNEYYNTSEYILAASGKVEIIQCQSPLPENIHSVYVDKDTYLVVSEKKPGLTPLPEGAHSGYSHPDFLNAFSPPLQLWIAPPHKNQKGRFERVPRYVEKLERVKTKLDQMTADKEIDPSVLENDTHKELCDHEFMTAEKYPDAVKMYISENFNNAPSEKDVRKILKNLYGDIINVIKKQNFNISTDPLLKTFFSQLFQYHATLYFPNYSLSDQSSDDMARKAAFLFRKHFMENHHHDHSNKLLIQQINDISYSILYGQIFNETCKKMKKKHAYLCERCGVITEKQALLNQQGLEVTEIIVNEIEAIKYHLIEIREFINDISSNPTTFSNKYEYYDYIERSVKQMQDCLNDMDNLNLNRLINMLDSRITIFLDSSIKKPCSPLPAENMQAIKTPGQGSNSSFWQSKSSSTNSVPRPAEEKVSRLPSPPTTSTFGMNANSPAFMPRNKQVVTQPKQAATTKKKNAL